MCASDAHASSRDSTGIDSILVLPEVRVERDRPLSTTRERRPTAFVSELEMRSSGRAIETVGEVLRSAPGVHITQYGGFGSFSTVSLRGAPAGQVAVYMDGVPMHSASQTVVDLSSLPVTSLETVEVYRGGSPLLMGSARPGGAVNLVSGEGGNRSEFSVARGSFETWEARGTGGFSMGTLSGWLHAGYQGTAGDFTFPDDNGTPFNLADDETSTRLNNRFDSGTGLARLAWRPTEAWQVSTRLHAYRKAQGFPGLGASPAMNARYELERWVGQGDVTRSFGNDGVLAVETSVQRERSQFVDTEGKLGVGRHETDDRFASETYGARMRSPRLPWRTSVELVASQRDERADLSNAANAYADPPQSRRRTRGLAIEGRVSPWRPLQIVAAQRWDRIDDELRSSGFLGRITETDVQRDVAAPQVGARVAMRYGLELRANWSHAQRIPDFTELFGNQGAIVGNAALEPERVENRDVGAAWQGRLAGYSATVEWAHFASDAEDLIVYVRNSPSSAKAQNISRARIRGDEVSLQIGAPAGFAFTGSVTWQSAIDVGDVPFWTGKRLPQRPGVQSYARLAWQGGPLLLAGDVQYMGDNYLDRYNSYRISSRTLVGTMLGYTFASSGMRLTLEGKNLGDSRVADVAGYPLPGRSFYAALGWRLGPAGPDDRQEN